MGVCGKGTGSSASLAQQSLPRTETTHGARPDHHWKFESAAPQCVAVFATATRRTSCFCHTLQHHEVRRRGKDLPRRVRTRVHGRRCKLSRRAGRPRVRGQQETQRLPLRPRGLAPQLPRPHHRQHPERRERGLLPRHRTLLQQA